MASIPGRAEPADPGARPAAAPWSRSLSRAAEPGALRRPDDRARGQREPHQHRARRATTRRCSDYNTEIRTFPSIIGAKVIHGAKPMVPFEADAGAQTAPTVDLDNIGAPAAGQRRPPTTTPTATDSPRGRGELTGASMRWLLRLAGRCWPPSRARRQRPRTIPPRPAGPVYDGANIIAPAEEAAARRAAARLQPHAPGARSSSPRCPASMAQDDRDLRAAAGRDLGHRRRGNRATACCCWSRRTSARCASRPATACRSA